MAVETKPLTAEDVAKIVNETLDKREVGVRKRRRDGLQIDDAELAKMEQHAELVAEYVCESPSFRKALDGAVKKAVEESKPKESVRKPGFWG